MLLNIVKNLFSIKKNNYSESFYKKFNQARDLAVSGRFREALILYQQCLEIKRDDCVLLTEIGVCYAELGDNANAHRYFEFSYIANDKYTPAIVNHAKFLLEKKWSKDAEYFLNIAKISDPNFNHTDAVYASMCLNVFSNPERAAKFQLKSWLKNFNSLRFANCFLFYNAYSDINEELLAAEHLFWAKTLKKNENSYKFSLKNTPIVKKKKIRIGYWSPDLRNHSVRYFFRPIIENHNKESFDIFLYDDTASKDKENEKIKVRCDAYFDTFNLTNDDLAELLLSHKLDILVEMAGHSSFNRIDMLQNRYATLQVTGIGYPPTTGLETIDAKILDRFLITENYKKYYSENPMILPNSFWCFDPMEDDAALLSDTIPLLKNKYVTFSCVGNLSKITDKIIQCWKLIIDSIPKSELVIKSVSFEDENSIGYIYKKLLDFNFPMKRVVFKKPTGGKEFFESYNDVDIILDTYPFNGGTTTCFAVYMGVPVVSLSGQSLISRMGHSILNNLGAGELVATTHESYVSIAIELSQKIEFLKKFKIQAREQMKASALGNGAVFTKDLESSLKDFLHAKETGQLFYQNEISPLPENDILSRAISSINSGSYKDARRIIDYCLSIYPQSSFAKILISIILKNEGNIFESINFLKENYKGFDSSGRLAASLNIARNYLLCEKIEESCAVLREAFVIESESISKEDCFNKLQWKLISASLEKDKDKDKNKDKDKYEDKEKLLFLIAVVSSNSDNSSGIKEFLECEALKTKNISIEVNIIDHDERISVYENFSSRNDGDYIIIIQNTIELISSELFFRVIDSLKDKDVLSYCGGISWDNLDWRDSKFDKKSGAFLRKSLEKEGLFDVNIVGSASKNSNFSILAGDLLACKKEFFDVANFKQEYKDSGFWMEQIWTNEIFKKGGRLCVGKGIFPLIREIKDLDSFDSDAVLNIVKENNFDVFSLGEYKSEIVSWPSLSFKDGVKTLEKFYSIN